MLFIRLKEKEKERDIFVNVFKVCYIYYFVNDKSGYILLNIV